jgi:2-hydroxyacyl-CoA lyase 1
VDLPTELIMEPVLKVRRGGASVREVQVRAPPKPMGDVELVREAAKLLQSAEAPLVILGKGAAYARAEGSIRQLVSTHNLPFLPTPMGKGIVPDSNPLNTSSARSAALKHADVILLLGGRLNWILHHGEAPKYRPDVKIIQVDISPDELGRVNSSGQPSLGILGDIDMVVKQIHVELGNSWRSFPSANIHGQSATKYLSLMSLAASKNEARSLELAHTTINPDGQLTYERTYHIIKSQLDTLSPPSDGNVVYVSEGANTMDISRSYFPLEHPRTRLDAGSHGTMGVGLGYAIAAYAAHNMPNRTKKIVALEGDSAFGFSGMEIETMARHKMDVMIIVMNNSGIYKGDSGDKATWDRRQEETVADTTRTIEASDKSSKAKKGLRSTSLLYETRYEKMAEMVRGRGWLVRTEGDLAQAVREAFLETEKVCLLNVIIDPGLNMAAQFGWMEAKEKHGGKAAGEPKL